MRTCNATSSTKNPNLVLWSSMIQASQDLKLATEFFNTTKEPEKIKECFIASAQDFARNDILLQEKVEHGDYEPVLPREEIEQIAADSVRDLVRNKDYRKALSNLQYAVFSARFPQDELKQLVEAALEQTTSRFKPDAGIDLNFVVDLIGYTSDDDGAAYDIDLSYDIFSNDESQKFVPDDLAIRIVTLKVFNKICLGRFEKAKETQDKYPDKCDTKLLRTLISVLVEFVNMPDNSSEAIEFDRYNDEYFACALRSDFKELFSELIPPRKLKQLALLTESALARKHYTIDQLHDAFNKAGDFLDIFDGLRKIEDLLKSKEYIEEVGEAKVNEVLKQRIESALASGKADTIYNLLFGMSLGEDKRIGGIEELQKFLPISKCELLEKMIDAIDWDVEHLLSEYDFSFDNFGRDDTEIINAFELYEELRDSGSRLPPEEKLKKLIFLNIAINAKDYYEGRGMKTIVDICENPANKPYLEGNEIKRLLTKIFNEYIERTLIGGFTSPKFVTYFYTLASSRLGELFKEDQRLKTYFELHSFLSTSQRQI